MGIMVVMDKTKNERKLTTALLGVSAMLGITLGSLFANSTIYIDLILIFFTFSSFYFSRFGSRYFSLSMIGFMTVYFSSILNLSIAQLPWFYFGVAIGVIYAFTFNFVFFQGTGKNLKRSIHSFHFQINLTFNILIKGIKNKGLSDPDQSQLQKNVVKLREYARIVSSYIDEADVQEAWPGLTPTQLRLYIFDTGMLIETLTDAMRSLKKAEALELDELRHMLVWVTEALRDAEVLAPNYEEQNIREAELALQALRLTIIDLLNQNHEPKGWIFLIRRIESIANHVIEGAFIIQQALYQPKPENKIETEAQEADKLPKEEPLKKEKTLQPTTKKAFQALVAAVLSIIVGQMTSPTQPYWVLLTAFIVLLGTESIGRIYTKGFQRSLGTIIGAIIGFVLAKALTGQSLIEVILIFVVVFLAFYLFAVSYTLMSMFITMLIAFMYDLLLGGITFSLIGARVVDTIVGAAIALGVSFVVFPKKTKDKVAESISDYFEELKPYVTSYVRSFREDVKVKELSGSAFQLEQKLQTIREESHSITQRPESLLYGDITRWITVLTAINYYARHLVASSYRKDFEYPEELIEVFNQIEKKLEHNMNEMSQLIKGSIHSSTLYQLEVEREKIERLAPGQRKSGRDLIHHLYYVWRINQSLILLGTELKAKVAIGTIKAES
ncbi:FUSC family protein [Bacillus carboniphilus]|uniref:FUSC family protein n=2 Tax=Bacillus carboniphilus TaxID=86663 RepID=A0ABP3GHI1_9BACI